MDFRQILIAAGMIGGMGLVFGAVLAIVGRIFRTEDDPRKEQVRALLPGANCGGCGYPGCDAYAEAILKGEATVDKCPVGGDSVMRAIAEVMGVTASAKDRKVATVRFRGSLDRCNLRFDYDGPRDCKSASLAGEGDKACEYSCLGFGDCESACPFDAIHVTDGRLAVVDDKKCVGCGVCLTACPRGVLQLMTYSHPVHSACSAHLSGKVVRDACKAGCIGCGKCQRACKFDALKLINNLPEIDFDKCKACMQCVDNCPTGAIMAFNEMRRHAMIHYPDCTGCGDCQKVCKFEAIRGEGDAHRSIIEWNCVGCGECAEVCPHNCIEMRPGGVFRK